MRYVIAPFIASLLCGLAPLASAETLVPGTYWTQGSWGTLVIRADGAFEIDTIGTNAHTCGLEGKIIGRRAVTPEGCAIDFVARGAQITVAVDHKTDSACRSYCGARAWFAGTYLPEVLACREEPVAKARKEFLGLYDKREHREAARVLTNLLRTCGQFLYWTVDAEVRNDLSIALHHSGDQRGCLRVLAPLRAAFIEDPAVSGRAFAPVDEDWGQQMMRTTRFNWKLCGGSVPATNP